MSEDSAQKDDDILMDTDDFVQPAPPEDSQSVVNGQKSKETDSPAASTIMITNKYSNSASQKHNSNNSIMILTSHNHTDVSSNITSSSQINICINNHFSDTITSSSSASLIAETEAKGGKVATPQKKTTQITVAQQLDEPDSTTCHFKDSTINRSQPLAAPVSVILPPKEPKLENSHPPAADTLPPPPKTPVTFTAGDEVFVRKDDIFYLGTVVVVGRKQCCVSFGDDTKCWAYFHEMSKINLAPEANPFCVHCKERSGPDPEVTVDVCKRCHRGYHKKCTGLDPKTGAGNHCKRCLEQNSLNGVNGAGRFCYKNNNNTMGDERLSYSDNSLSPWETGNFFPLRSSEYKDAWSAGSPNNLDLSTAPSNGNNNNKNAGRKMSTCGRRLRERQEKNYAESTRRSAAPSSGAAASAAQGSSGCSNSDTSSSSSSSSSLMNFSATTFLSQQLLSSQRQGTSSRAGVAAVVQGKGLSFFSKIFDTNTSSHMAKGEKYVIRGKRIDNDGNIQYLVEWEGVS
ncbi:hypothetical protein DMENIID0001_096190 [Sergentomyia squamirostris]